MIDGRSGHEAVVLPACACMRCADINACIHACATDGVAVTAWFPLIVKKIEEVIGNQAIRAQAGCPLWRAEAEGIIQVLRGDAVLAMALPESSSEPYMTDVLEILVQAMRRLVSYRSGPDCGHKMGAFADGPDKRFAA